MLPVGHRPILEHIVEWLKGNGITDIVISTGYLGGAIEDHFRDGADFRVRIEYARARKPLGIAGQLRNAEDKLGERFVCLYGDAILDFDLRRLLEFHAAKRATLTMALMSEKIQGKYGVIELEEDGAIRRWKEKPVIENDINIGCYVMQRAYLDYIPTSSTYGMKEAFEAALEEPRARSSGSRSRGRSGTSGDRAAYREARHRLLLEPLREAPRRRLRGKKEDGYVLDEEMALKASGLVCLTGGDEGPLAYALAMGEIRLGIEKVEQLCQVFGRDNVYVELQRHFNRAEERRNQAAVEIARKLRLPLLATNGVCYARPDQRQLLDAFICIRNHRTLATAGRILSQNSERYLKAPDEMVRLFSDLPEAVENTGILSLAFGIHPK